MTYLDASRPNAPASVEHYTPAHIVDAARLAMGGIDLDPASCAEANDTVRAASYFDARRDGLATPWFGRVWCNPPFGRDTGAYKSRTATWVQKAVAEHDAGRADAVIMLVPAVIEKVWFRELVLPRGPICIARALRFSGKGPSPIGSAIFALGVDRTSFIGAFRAHGKIVELVP